MTGIQIRKAKSKSGRRGRSGKRKPPVPKQEIKKKGGAAEFQNIDEDAGIDFQTLVQKEYMKLHRQYRIMEDNRRLLAGKSKGLSRKGKLLQQLGVEKEDLETDIMNAECETYRERDRKSIQTILMILEDYETCLSEIDICWKNVREMELNVDKITKRLVEQKLKVQALYGRSMTLAQAEHRKRILEDRLYYATTQLDTKVSANKEFREEINMMLKLRGIFYSRLIAMKRLIGTSKMKMGELVYLATSAYEQRDDWVSKIRSLRERNDKDSKQHVLEIKEFNRILHHDSKLHGFMSLKNQERELMESSLQRHERKNRVKLEEMIRRLKEYEYSFKKILRFVQSRSMETLVHNYLELEQSNFASFKYITDLNHEINALSDQNVTLVTEIEEVYANNKQVERDRRAALIKSARAYELENKKLDKVIEIWDHTEAQMEILIRILDAMFDVSRCSNTAVVRLLGNLKGVNPRNVSFCMRVIEGRVSELLKMKAEYEVRELVELKGQPLPKKATLLTSQGVGSKQKHSGGPFIPKIQVTGHLDGEQDEDDEDRALSDHPISYNDWKVRILEKMNHAKEGGSTKSARPSMMIESDPSGISNF